MGHHYTAEVISYNLVKSFFFFFEVEMNYNYKLGGIQYRP